MPKKEKDEIKEMQKIADDTPEFKEYCQLCIQEKKEQIEVVKKVHKKALEWIEAVGKPCTQEQVNTVHAIAELLKV